MKAALEATNNKQAAEQRLTQLQQAIDKLVSKTDEQQQQNTKAAKHQSSIDTVLTALQDDLQTWDSQLRAVTEWCGIESCHGYNGKGKGK